MNLTQHESNNRDEGQGNPIVVGATDSYPSYDNPNMSPNFMSNFSNYGLGNTINAPVKSLIIPRYDWEEGTNEVFRWRTGTSFSCPIIAGLVCLYLEENPSASVSDVKKWLIDESGKNEIKNLINPISLKDSEFILERKNNIATINLNFDLTNDQLNCKKIQIVGIDKELSLFGFDGWYEVIKSDDKNKLYLDFKEKSEKNLKIKLLESTELTFLDNTHESTDGIIKWQSESENNFLIKNETLGSDEYFKINTVEKTPNRIAFNPYLSVTYTLVDEYGIETRVDEGLLNYTHTLKYIVTDFDIGKSASFTFLYEDKTSEILKLQQELKKGKKYYYTMPTTKKVISFYRGNDIKKVIDSYYIYGKIKIQDNIKENATQNQLQLIEFFENYSKKDHVLKYKFEQYEETDSLNEPFDVVRLKNSDFASGTVRITKHGYYFLSEDVLFHPNAENDFMPTFEQIKNKIYPVGRGGAYHLGFFAAITVESDDVILDLNGHTIQQTKKHNLMQRFFSCIELASASVYTYTRTHSFSETYKSANRVCIINGNLDVSSHHGIHANLANDVLLSNLTIKNFEVAGIALNGTKNAVLNNLTIEGTYLKIMFYQDFLRRVY